MEKMTELEARLVALESAVALLMRISPHAELLLKQQQDMANELRGAGAPAECFKLIEALQKLHITAPPAASEAPPTAG